MRPLKEAQQHGEEVRFSAHCHSKLWVQSITQEGKVKITKILGASTLADLGTKHFDGGSIAHNLENLRFATHTVHDAEAKNHDKERILHEQRQLSVLKFERSKDFDARAECAGRVESHLRRKVRKLDP